MSPLRLNGSTSGYSQLDAPAIAGDQTFTLPGTGGTIDRLNRAGNILQVVNATYSTSTSNSTSTFADTGLTATITPTSSTSKILILISQSSIAKINDTYCVLRLQRNSTTLIEFERNAGYTATAAQIAVGGGSTCYLDSPATTSAVTYKTQFMSGANIASVTVQTAGGAPTPASTITLMEVAA